MNGVLKLMLTILIIFSCVGCSFSSNLLINRFENYSEDEVADERGWFTPNDDFFLDIEITDGVDE